MHVPTRLGLNLAITQHYNALGYMKIIYKYSFILHINQ